MCQNLLTENMNSDGMYCFILNFMENVCGLERVAQKSSAKYESKVQENHPSFCMPILAVGGEEVHLLFILNLDIR